MRTMPWGSPAWRAFARAFAPMPPPIKRRTMETMAARVEAVARGRGLGAVGLDEVYAGCADALATKGAFMLESLDDALRAEGYVVDEE
jgi:hypothetical protein